MAATGYVLERLSELREEAYCKVLRCFLASQQYDLVSDTKYPNVLLAFSWWCCRYRAWACEASCSQLMDLSLPDSCSRTKSAIRRMLCGRRYYLAEHGILRTAKLTNIPHLSCCLPLEEVMLAPCCQSIPQRQRLAVAAGQGADANKAAHRAEHCRRAPRGAR